MPARQLPVSPDVHHVKVEAKNLLRAFRAGDSAALADFREFSSSDTDATNAKLSDAQLVLARSYGATSFPQLIAAVEFIRACWSNDGNRVRDAVAAHLDTLKEYYNPSAHRGWREDLMAAAMQGQGVLIRHMGESGRLIAVAQERQEHMRSWMSVVSVLSKFGRPSNGHRSNPPIVITAKRETPIDEQEELRKRTEKAVREAAEEEARHVRVAQRMRESAQNPARTDRMFERMRAHNVQFRDMPQSATPEQRRQHDLLQECFRLYIESHPLK